MEKMILFFGYTDFSGRMLAGSLQEILSQNGYTDLAYELLMQEQKLMLQFLLLNLVIF